MATIIPSILSMVVSCTRRSSCYLILDVRLMIQIEPTHPHSLQAKHLNWKTFHSSYWLGGRCRGMPAFLIGLISLGTAEARTAELVLGIVVPALRTRRHHSLHHHHYG